MPTDSDKQLAGLSDRERALTDRSTTLRRAAPSRLARLPLGPEEGYVVSRVDRPMPISQILQVCGLPESQALLVLLNLLEKGALVLPGEDAGDALDSTPPPKRSAYDDDFIFNTRELNEDIDLDFERKKQILFLYNRRDNISHYRLLGVNPNATDGEIRKAFLEKSRLYHPDTYFRKRLGSYKERLEVLFQRVKEAHDTLMDSERRRKYEWDARRLFTPDEVSVLVQREIDSIEDERRKKGRRNALLRSKGFSKLTRARDLVAEGDKFLASGDIKDAIQRYQAASDLDPRLEMARQRLAEARKAGIAQRVEMAIGEAARLEAEGNASRAVELLKSSIEIDPTNPRIYVALAELLTHAGGDLKEARSHVQRAITLGDSLGSVRTLHGEILLRLGLKKAARAELEFAIARGESGRAEALLREC